MSLFEREGFEKFISNLKAVEIVHQWGDASVGNIGGKIFAIYSIWNEADVWHISFKCSDMSFEMLPNLEGIRPAKYLARAKWVDVSPSSELEEEDIAAYIVQAHKLIGQKLSKKLREELGL